MVVTIKRNPKASGDRINNPAWLEIRSPEGFLCSFIIFPPGEGAFLISNSRDEDFIDTARNFSIDLDSSRPGISVFSDIKQAPARFEKDTWIEISHGDKTCVVLVAIPNKPTHVFDAEDPALKKILD